MNKLIITLAPFPSIEYIYRVETFKPGEVLTSKNVSLNILSKGVYSAQIMKVLQAEPVLISSFGGFAGKSIKHYLDKSKVKSDIVWTEDETPHQVKIIIQDQPEAYILRSQEHFTLEKEYIKLTHKLKSHINKVSTLVLSGKLPHQLASQMMTEWISLAKAQNVKTVISTGQKEVWDVLKENKPYAILLTEDQLRDLELAEDTIENTIRKLAFFLGEGLHYICIYLKNKGAFILTKNKYCYVQSPFHLLNLNNTATSGAFLGALAIAINRNYEQEKIAKFCLAAALSADDNAAHSISNRKDIEYGYKKTKVKQIYV